MSNTANDSSTSHAYQKLRETGPFVKNRLVLLLVFALGLPLYTYGNQPVLSRNEVTMNIEIRSATARVTASLVDNEATRDFLKLLPLTLTLEDYANTEKISDLPQRLSLAGADDGYTPAAGDIAYYAPWGNLAIFLKDFRYSRGLIPLGRITENLHEIARPGPVEVTITQAN